jgi:hypothetical protein
MTELENHGAPHADLGAHGRRNLNETARVISLADARRALAARNPDPFSPEVDRPEPAGGSISPAGVGIASHTVTDLGAIAEEPSFAIRRRKLAEAMTAISGEMPNERTLDHRMIATGLAAGHGGADPDGRVEWPLGSTLDDPAVVVGLVLHHARHGGVRGLPIPPSVQHALDRHVAAGSDAARLVRDWWRMRAATAVRRHLQVYEGGKR